MLIKGMTDRINEAIEEAGVNAEMVDSLLDDFLGENDNDRMVSALEDLVGTIQRSEDNQFTELEEDHYERLVVILNKLVDIVREDEDHILASLMEFIGNLIKRYEDEHIPEPVSRSTIDLTRLTDQLTDHLLS